MRYDVAIVGAGPAGCSAAITLARAGRSVVVLEKREFPRHKICGGCLSGWAVSQLRELLGRHHELSGTNGSQILFSIGGRTVQCRIKDQTRIVLRAEFDSMLAAAAVSEGAEIRFGQQAALTLRNENFAVTMGDHQIRAKTILLASGVGGLANKLGFRSVSFGSPMIGRQWFDSVRSVGIAPGAIEMHWLRGGYIGLAALDETICIVALAMKAKNNCGENPLQSLQRVNPEADVWNRIHTATREGVRGAAGFPFAPRQLLRANIMLIGDAAGYSEPFSGTGIGMAIHSGVIAARAIIDGGPVADNYSRSMRTHRKIMWQTRMLSALLNSNTAQRILSQGILQFDNWISKVVQHVHVRSTL